MSTGEKYVLVKADFQGSPLRFPCSERMITKGDLKSYRFALPGAQP